MYDVGRRQGWPYGRKARAWLAAVSAVALAAMLSGLGAATPASAASGSQPRSGGTLTILENSGLGGEWPQGLDPGPNACCAITDWGYEEAIFGGLFAMGDKGQPEPDLATGWKFSNGDKTLELFLRHGVKFTDGTPFNAAAVAWNIRRDLLPANQGKILFSSFPVSSVTTRGQYTVVLHLAEPFAPIIDSLIAVAPTNFIASPTAYRKMGAKAFSLKPVGAGPFEVVSDTQNSELTLKKNPHYWQKGHPYLDKVIFKAIGADESAYEALLAGDAQAAQQVASVNVVQTAKKNPMLRVEATPGSGTTSVELNTKVAPFNNIKAREAIYYALNPAALNKVVAGGNGTVEETGDGPASLFSYGKIPGYRTYNLAKAKALVRQLGGLSFSTIAVSNPQLAEAEESEFAAAGMKTKITTVNLAQLVSAFQHNSWQLTQGGAGGLDPAIGTSGMTWRVVSNGPFAGIDDPQLDKLVHEGSATTSHAARSKIYQQIYQSLSDKAYMPFLYAIPTFNLSAREVHGPGFTSPMYNPFAIGWQDVWVAK